jgi:large subunit ribosomal protein L10
MARPDKVAKVEEVSERLSSSGATLLTHYRGLSVTEMAELRRSLRAANAEMRVVKNTLTRRAAERAGIDGLDDLLVGPTGLVFCEDDPVAPAKALKAFAKDHPDLEVRGGWFDGVLLDAAEALRLAELESRDELLTRFAGLLYGALANTARLLQAPLEQQARVLQALVDAGGTGAADAAVQEAPAAEPTTEDAPDDVAEEAPVAEPSAEDASDAESSAEDATTEDAEDDKTEPAAAEAGGDDADTDAPDED